MIDDKYFEGFEGEREVYIYYVDKKTQEKTGLLIWEGYFEFLLSACYFKNFEPGGLLECYFYVNGFYDDSPWKIKNILLVIKELNKFDVNNVESNDGDTINVLIKLRKEILSFLKKANKEKEDVYIEYN